MSERKDAARTARAARTAQPEASPYHQRPGVKWYGWRRDMPDGRDLPFKLRLGVAPALPAQASVEASMPRKIWNQGAEGSCTAHAALAADMAARKIQRTHDMYEMPSRAFEYWATRWLEGTTDRDAGGSIRDAIKALAQFGVLPEAMFPYRVGGFADLPGDALMRRALKDQAIEYARVRDGDLYAIRACLAGTARTATDGHGRTRKSPAGIGEVMSLSGFPVVFGFLVFPQFESKDCAKTGIVTMPGRRESLIGAVGGHAVCAVAYDDNKKMPDGTGAIKCRNSWGAAWGDKGHFWLPYGYFAGDLLANDFWVVKRVE